MARRKFAVDCDGVLFNFNHRYGELIEQTFGIKVPPTSDTFPSEWNWESSLGLTKKQVRELWNTICGDDMSYRFWRYLPVYDKVKMFLMDCAFEADMIFVTARCGRHCQRATEDALKILGVENPQVFIAHNKMPVLMAENVTDFIDDRDKKFDDIFNSNEVHEGNLRLWILDRPWNRHYNHPSVTRIKTLKEALNNGIK